MTGSPSRSELLNLYRRLLRACEKYPSKNKMRIYQSIQEDFRANVRMDPTSEKTAQQISVALKGLSQLHQFDSRVGATSFAVQLEQNPFPKPDNYVDKRTERVEKLLSKDDKDENGKSDR
jgi:Complex 1 protein (LYR family)